MAGGQHSEDTSEGPQAKGELALGTTQQLGPLPRSWEVQYSHGAASVVGPSGATSENSRLENPLAVQRAQCKSCLLNTSRRLYRMAVM